MRRIAFKVVGGGVLTALAVAAVVVPITSNAATAPAPTSAATSTSIVTSTQTTCPPTTLGVTEQPVSQTVIAGQTATFTASAFRALCAITVQWFVSTDGGTTFTAIPGATSDSLVIPDTTTAQSGYEYYAEFTSQASVHTNTVTLTVQPATPPPPAPTVTAVYPRSGPAAGGIAIISGTGLRPASAIAFGGVGSRFFYVVSSRLAIALVPAHPAGTVDVTVTGPGGTSALSAADRYTYIG